MKGQKEIKIKIMKNLVSAKIKTKSNYGNLNGKFYQVTEMVGTRVTCICEIDGRIVHVDFNLSEVLEFNYNN